MLQAGILNLVQFEPLSESFSPLQVQKQVPNMDICCGVLPKEATDAPSHLAWVIKRAGKGFSIAIWTFLKE